MRTILKIAALTIVVFVPITGAQATYQGSNEAEGYAQSWGATDGYYYGGYESYGYERNHRWR